MATAQAIDHAKREIEDSPEGQRLKGKVLGRAQEAIDWELPKHDTDDFLHVSRGALKHLQALGIAWLLEKNEPKYVDRAKEILRHVCGFPDWNPPHFLDTAEMTHAVAIGYDWFYDRLRKPDRDMCVRAIIDKGLRPGLAQFTGTPRPNWPIQTKNWNIVCNAGLMIGALAVAEEQDDLPGEVFRRCLNSVPTGFRGYSPDGSWDEGPGYWAYATEYAAYLLSSLKTALDQEFGLADLPGFRRAGFFRMHCEGDAAADGQAGKFFNFSDGEETHRGSWVMRWLSRRFDEPMYNWVALKDRQSKPMDLLWFSPQSPPSGASIKRNAVFRGIANVAMLRGSWDKRSDLFRFQPWARRHSGNIYLGIRAGANTIENAHGHLDLGSFVLDALQLRWATDIPSTGAQNDYYGDYELPGYFDVAADRRFRYYRTHTVGHNALVINGFNQPLGVQTEIVAFRDASPELVVVVVDLTAAYPDCLRVRRGFALIDGRHVLIVDELTPKKEMTVAWQMHTRAQARKGTVVRLTQRFEDKRRKISELRRFFAQILQPRRARFEVEPAQVTQPREAPNADIRKLVATLRSVKQPTRIAVYLSTQRKPVPLPPLLRGPLWTWIEWAGRQPAIQLPGLRAPAPKAESARRGRERFSG